MSKLLEKTANSLTDAASGAMLGSLPGAFLGAGIGMISVPKKKAYL